MELAALRTVWSGAALRRLSKNRHEKLASSLIVAVALLAVLPFGRNGFLLSLDMVFTPRTMAPDGHLGDFGRGLRSHIFGNLPFFMLVEILRSALGMEIVQRLLVASIFVGAGLGAFFSLPFRDTLPRLAGSLFCAFNLFVLQRLLAGHILILLAYALVTPTIFLFVGRNRRARAAATALLAVMGILSVQFFMMTIAFLFLLATFEAINAKSRAPLLRAVVHSSLAIGINLFWIIPHLITGTALDSINEADLHVFAPRDDLGIGAPTSVVVLGGFWRAGWHHPFADWPAQALLAGIVGLLVAGVTSQARDKFPLRPYQLGLAWGCVAILAIGAASPATRPLAKVLFTYVPFYEGFRDSQKIAALLVPLYALFLGRGVTALLRLAENLRGVRAKNSMAMALVFLVGAYGAVNIVALHGQLQPTEYPESWKALEKSGRLREGRTLVLPWHLYQEFDWVQGMNHRVATPTQWFLTGDIVQGDNIEIGPIYSQSRSGFSTYIEAVLAEPNATRLGNMLSVVGIDKVMLLRTWDSGTYSAFLDRQQDLRQSHETDDFTLYENNAPASREYLVDRILEVNDVRDVARLSDCLDLWKFAIVIREGASASCETHSSALIPAGVTGVGPPADKTFGPDLHGYLVLSLGQEIESRWWEHSSGHAVDGVANNLVVPIDGSTRVRYVGFAELYLPSYALSAIVFGVGLALHIRQSRRDLETGPPV